MKNVCFHVVESFQPSMDIMNEAAAAKPLKRNSVIKR